MRTGVGEAPISGLVVHAELATAARVPLILRSLRSSGSVIGVLGLHARHLTPQRQHERAAKFTRALNRAGPGTDRSATDDQ